MQKPKGVTLLRLTTRLVHEDSMGKDKYIVRSIRGTSGRGSDPETEGSGTAKID